AQAGRRRRIFHVTHIFAVDPEGVMLVLSNHEDADRLMGADVGTACHGVVQQCRRLIVWWAAIRDEVGGAILGDCEAIHGRASVVRDASTEAGIEIFGDFNSEGITMGNLTGADGHVAIYLLRDVQRALREVTSTM